MTLFSPAIEIGIIVVCGAIGLLFGYWRYRSSNKRIAIEFVALSAVVLVCIWVARLLT